MENVFVGELHIANRVCAKKVKNKLNGTHYINMVSKCKWLTSNALKSEHTIGPTSPLLFN